MTNELGTAAIALEESVGDGISEVRALEVERDPQPEIEEILGPEEFEALLLEGSATFEPSAPEADHATAAPERADLRSSGTWPKHDLETGETVAEAASTLRVFPIDSPKRGPRVEPPLPPRREPRDAPAVRVAAPLPNLDTAEEVNALRAELTRLSRQMRARDAYLQELERALEHNRRELATAGLSTGLTAARLFGRLRGQTFRIAELEADLRQAQLALATLRAAQQTPAGARDDLRAIKGIGPRFAQQLRELGFSSYASIAGLSSDDILRIATRLRISTDRIERDAWIEQARVLVSKSAPRVTD